MPFSTTASIVSTDLDNMLRGLNRDNSDTAHTGDTAETTLKSYSIAANTIGATGGFRVFVAGTISGTAGTKTIRLYLGATVIETITQAAGTVSDWFFDGWCFNTATNAQRWHVRQNTNDATTVSEDYTTSAIDTTASQTLKVTVQLGNSGDTVTATMWDVFVVQIQ